ncbi:MAG: UDP-N-acetylmuramoyl-tripeptide--D-alanyl-D-alanine ligase [Flavobacteriales bacterium]|jgi:UDP-N-acetylmuramoyl-tripeptide--D-alanyl-D-alanine ligase|nr:UDP-N-acetylmuramoyl-tripeptide--D-alanyl-D-alanine ligase [Flavobacteriales bacterium]
MKLQTLYQLFLKSNGVSTDTRTITQDQIYFALKGDNFDGNQYVQKALDQGALVTIIDDENVKKEQFDKQIQVVLVENVLRTLQDLARWHRKQIAIPILGITGTNGKTTSKELCKAFFEKKLNVYATPGNLNNHIGVPLCLLELTSQHDFAIIEMGANHQGEIKELSEIALPDYGFITNIGKAHLEGFGSPEIIQKTKKELFDFIVDSGGFFFYNCEEEKVAEFAKEYYKSIPFSTEESVERKFKILPNIMATIEIDGKEIPSNLFGDYNAKNMAAAYFIGNFFDLDLDTFALAMKDYQPQNNRSQSQKTDKNHLIVDAYNANPTSMKLAVEAFLNSPVTHKVLILGDMFELGEGSSFEHIKILKILQESMNSNDQAFLVGEEFLKVKIAAQNLHFFESREFLQEFLSTNLLENKSILLKGSRGIGLEKIIDLL